MAPLGVYTRLMSASELRLLENLRVISRFSLIAGILVSLIMATQASAGIEWQVALSVLALAIGIPHGAVDHLITVPKLFGLKMVLFMAGYLGVVALVIAFILNQNTLGFQVVVLISAVHFGVGDAAFVSEIDSRNGTTKRFSKIAYAVAAGSVPVVIPLVNSQSTAALERVNPNLVNWVAGLAPIILTIAIVVASVSIMLMMVSLRWQEAFDLALLLTLALVAPPLVAFAFYFGLWHALRHTGRLTLELKSAKRLHEVGKSFGAFANAFVAGVPALGITIVGALLLGWSRGFQFGQDFLWYLLVVVWALTVPHMALTAKLDIKALESKK